MTSDKNMTTLSNVDILEFEEDPSLSDNLIDKPHWKYTLSSSGTIQTKRFFNNVDTRPSNLAWKFWLYHYSICLPKKVLMDMFLPLDYPHSVTNEYISYQICDSIQGLCSYLRGVVSTSAVLTAAGVGNSEATAMSAAMTWALRDGLGMIGGLIFSYHASSLFDAHIKEFRLFADIINDVGLTLDMMTPYLGSNTNHILILTSLATVCKVMCGISAGATKGCITQHFATRGNMADLNAKEGTQETLVSLLGMILGVILARNLHQLEQQDKNLASSISWIIFNTLTLVHVVVNYFGVKLLRLRTLNGQRCREAIAQLVDIAATNFRKTEKLDSNDPWITDALSSIPSPSDVSESLYASIQRWFLSDGIILNTSFQQLLSHGQSSTKMNCMERQLKEDSYHYVLMTKSTLSSSSSSSRPTSIYITLKVGATDQDQLLAFLHAHLEMKFQELGISDGTLSHDCMTILIRHGLSLELFEKKGWDVKDRLYLGFGSRRVQYLTPKLKNE